MTGLAADMMPSERPTEPVQGMIEAVDHSGHLLARLGVTRWPVVVGRALGADLVLNDPHVAAQHLRIEPSTSGHLGVVQVLHTLNGVRLGRKHYESGQTFSWPVAEELILGHVRLRLRLAQVPLEPEQSLHVVPWRSVATTVALVLALLVLALVHTWLRIHETEQLPQMAVSLVGFMAGALALWAGLWALATKLFTGRSRFWQHVRIASVVCLLDSLVSGLGHLLAFVFSLESLARFNFLLSAPVVALGIVLQLLVIAPQRRRALVATVLTTTLLVVAAYMGSNWLQNRRWTNQLYMATIFPPSWRLAPAVPVDQFMRESAVLRQRLEQRLQDQPEERGEPDEE